MRRWHRILAFALFCGVAAAVAAQSQGATVAAGAVIAGQVSPWRNAQFVLYAYGAVWVGLALYLWRLAGLARRLSREVSRLEAAARGASEKGSIGS